MSRRREEEQKVEEEISSDKIMERIEGVEERRNNTETGKKGNK